MTRATAILLAAAVLAWQAGNAVQGHFVHRFLVADLAASAILLTGAVWAERRTADVIMLVGFSALFGIFLSATTGGLLVDGYHRTGTFLTSLGLVPCVAGVSVLAGRICRTDSNPARDSERSQPPESPGPA